MGLGVPELLIILAIVVVLFGAGRIAGIGGELGEAIKNFRQGIDDGSEKAKNEEA
jgi:sec-independent protein translocase protein TatA